MTQEITSSPRALITKINRVKRGQEYVQVYSSDLSSSLSIEFYRTVRVSDNEATSKLPPNDGKFPLHSVAEYEAKLPSNMSAKGGLFIPMHEREAMWIGFSSDKPFLVKVYAGGINAISGESTVEDMGSRLRRSTSYHAGKSIQDYLVTGLEGQLWLDGCAARDGSVRQFVAMTAGSGYSVESQLTGFDATCGLQLEVTPLKRPALKPSGPPTMEVLVQPAVGKILTMSVRPSDTVAYLKSVAEEKTGINSEDMNLVFAGKRLEDGETLSANSIYDHATIYMVLKVKGGGAKSALFDPMQETDTEMTIAAGGLIRQSIIADTSEKEVWDHKRTVTINVQLLNAQVFNQVTGKSPPALPMTAQAYATQGGSYFKIEDERPSGVYGKLFDTVKSVAQIDNTKPTSECRRAAAEVRVSTQNSLVLLNKDGTHRGFRHLSDLVNDVLAARVAHL